LLLFSLSDNAFQLLSCPIGNSSRRQALDIHVRFEFTVELFRGAMIRIKLYDVFFTDVQAGPPAFASLSMAVSEGSRESYFRFSRLKKARDGFFNSLLNDKMA
uniref:hypothetical protein n=1 Tax=Thiolapillus sp. TaxID=2017437 RepID=UPI003AF5C2B9